MPRPRISIASLLIVVVVVALALAAIRGASMVWAGLFTSITYFALLASLLAIGLGRGPRRVYWTGFALLGWGYIVLTHLPWTLGIQHNLFAPHAFEILFEALHPENAAGTMGGMGGMGGGPGMSGAGGGFRAVRLMGGMGSPPGSAVSLDAFSRIGSSLEALLWAFLGGWTARYFASGTRPLSGGVPPSPEVPVISGRREDKAGGLEGARAETA